MAVERFSRRWHLAYLAAFFVLVVVAVVAATKRQASLFTAAATILLFVGLLASFVMQRRARQRGADRE